MADEEKVKGGDLEQFQAFYKEWKGTWGRPVLDEIYLGHDDKARELLTAAKGELNQSTLPNDVIEALKYYLTYITCRLEWDPSVQGYTKEDYHQIISQLSIPAKTKFGDYTRRAYLVTFRCHGTADSFDELSKEDVEELLTPLPEDIAEASWQQIARWAFEQKELSILGRAFEMTLVNPSNYMGHARWQRVNMMYQLLSGKATRRDVEETIKTFAVHPQVVEFRDVIWPECVKAGLTDDELERLFIEKEAEILATTTAPGLEQRTKSILGKGERP